MSNTKQTSIYTSRNFGLTKGSFWAVVGLSVCAIITFSTLYFSYQNQEKYALNQINQQEKQRLLLAEQKSENTDSIENENLSNNPSQLLFVKSEDKPKTISNPTFIVELAQSKSNIADKIILSASIPKFEKASVNENGKEGNSNSLVNPANIISNSKNLTFLKLSLLSFGFNSSFSNNLFPHETNTEFTKSKFRKYLNWFTGISGGKGYYTNTKNYSNVVESQLSDLHYNLEDSKLISTQHQGNQNFNIGVFGGIQLFKRLDIEVGLVYNHSNVRFTCIYQNILKQEFTYVEWIPTGESGGPNGQPIYKPQNVVDNYLVTNQDTITTQANNYQIEIPLLFRYHFRFNKLSVFATLGSSAIVYSSYQVSTVNSSNGELFSAVSNDQFGVVQLNAIFGAGISYRLMGGLELKLEPMFRQKIKSQDEFLRDFKSNSGSLNAGLTYRF